MTGGGEGGRPGCARAGVRTALGGTVNRRWTETRASRIGERLRGVLGVCEKMGGREEEWEGGGKVMWGGVAYHVRYACHSCGGFDDGIF